MRATRASGREQTALRRHEAEERISYADLHQRLLEQFAPPSIVVNEDYDILHLSENAGRFLRIAGGEPSNNLLEMVRPELRLELRAAFARAAQKRINVVAEKLTVNTGDRIETLNLHVRPVLRDEDAARGFVLVVFEKTENAPEVEREIISTKPEPIARLLEEELMRVRARLQMSIEQYEVQTEELKASNEEYQAMNEELRSTGEELETGKEELQSVNEEMLTVNEELKIKIAEISQSNDDFQNLMSSSDIGTIFLDRELCVKMFTPPTRKIINLMPADLGRPLSDITTHFAYEGLHDDCEFVLEKLQTVKREIETADKRCILLRLLPYRTTEDRISGVVLTFLDITERKRREEEVNQLAEQIERQARLFDTTLTNISDFAYILDRDGRFVYSNQRLLDLLGITSEEIVGKNFFDLNYPDDLAARLQNQIQHVFETREIVRDETPFASASGEQGFYEYIFTPVFAADGTIKSVAGSTRDVTARKQAEEDTAQAERHLRIAVEAAKMGTWTWDLVTDEVVWNGQHFAMFGMKQKNPVKSADFYNHVHPDDREAVSERLDKTINEKVLFEAEFRAVLEDSSVRWMSGFGQVVEESGNRATRLSGVMLDINERKLVEEALRQSEEHARVLVESATDFAILRITPDNRIASWNSGAERVFGFKESEIIGQTGAILFTPEDREKGAPEKEIETARREGRAEDERWHIRKNGSRFYASGVMMRLKEGAEGFVKIARDQTKKIEAQKAVRDKEMLQKLVSAQEDERKRIARDLHDELGQKLTALRLKLENVRKLCEEEAICGRIEEVQILAKNIDADVDFLAWELRPAALDDLGLVAALNNYVNEWSRHAGVTIEFHASGLKRTRLAPEVETNLYRITQEALNNTHKHAKASRADVLLERRDGSVVLIIEDDGKGFNVKDKKNRSKGIGLTGMQERAALVGGSLEIESALRKGTSIFVRVPALLVKKQKEPKN